MKKLLVLLLILIIAAGGYGLYIYNLAGGFKSIAAAPANACRKVSGIRWPEDITIDQRNGYAFVTGLNREPGRDKALGPGHVYGYDLTDPDAKPTILTAGRAIQSHGLSFLPSGTGGTLMVVNHHHWAANPTRPDAIDIFRFADGKLTHVKSVTDERLTRANDLVAVAPDKFYVTIDHRHLSGIWRTIEDYGRMPWASVLYFDGSKFELAADGLRYANGITLSADGKTLYVAAITQPALVSYTRDPATGKLSNRNDLPLKSGPDNLEVDSDGAVWTGAHPNLFATAAALSKPGRTAPSEVLKIDPKSGKATQVYLDDGTQIALSTVAATWKNRLLIGSIGGDHFLDCQLDETGTKVK